MAIYSTEEDRTKLKELAEKLAERLRESKKLTNVWTSSASAPCAGLYIDMDREAMAKLGVSLNDAFTTLETHLGSVDINDFHGFGQTWQVKVAIDDGAGGGHREAYGPHPQWANRRLQ